MINYGDISKKLILWSLFISSFSFSNNSNLRNMISNMLFSYRTHCFFDGFGCLFASRTTEDGSACNCMHALSIKFGLAASSSRRFGRCRFDVPASSISSLRGFGSIIEKYASFLIVICHTLPVRTSCLQAQKLVCVRCHVL